MSLPRYLILATLSIIFSLVNFTLLKPLFDVIFEQVPTQALEQPPAFQPSIAYLTSMFNYYMLETVEVYGKEGALYFVCAVIIVSVFLANFFKYLANVTMAQIRARVVYNVRNGLFDKINSLHLGFFTNERKGDLMSRITNDVQEVENSVVNTLKVVYREPATLIGYFAVLFYMSAELTVFTLVLVPISGGIISEISKRLRKKARESQQTLGKIVNMLDETLSGMRVVKAFTAQGFLRKRFTDQTNRYAKINVSMARKNEAASPMSEFMGVTVVVGIVIYGGKLILSGSSELSGAEFFTYIALFSQVLTPAKAISKSFSVIQRGLASGERIFEVLDTTPTIQNAPNAQKLDSFKESIVFNNVSFAYEQEQVLKGINLEVKKGQTVALVGASGGGKSTLADLVPRFYDPTQGSLQIDGKDLREYDINALRSLMGIVTQESILFNDTIFNNIAFGQENVSEDAVIQAAKIANAHEFIMNTEQGYQTVIGERGNKLSGGQRQRLSIARAILKNPPILILDEATSALDSESERLVQEALTHLMQNRTSLVIAHRLSTIQHADHIVVLKSGQIIEQGTHQQLMEKEGTYKKLTLLQSV